jgi:hypothetical protein
VFAAPPEAAAVTGAVVAGAPLEMGGAIIKLGFSRVSRERIDRRVRNFMGNLNCWRKKFQRTQDSIPAIVSLFHQSSSIANSSFAEFLRPLPSLKTTDLTQPLEMT